MLSLRIIRVIGFPPHISKPSLFLSKKNLKIEEDVEQRICGGVNLLLGEFNIQSLKWEWNILLMWTVYICIDRIKDKTLENIELMNVENYGIKI